MEKKYTTKPKIVVFAGPNGSGKSTITSEGNIFGQYINADDIKVQENCSDEEAAIYAERLREACLANLESFTFETVLSTERNLNLLRRAKRAGYFIRGFYVLTCSPEINVARVKARVSIGGHDVKKEKIITRYYRALRLLPSFVDVCDVCSVYDNTIEPYRIYKKYHGNTFQENKFWSQTEIMKLVGLD